MSILTTIELDIEGFFSKAWGAVVNGERVIVKDAGILWDDLKGLVQAVIPEEYALLKSAAGRVAVDVLKGDIADFESAMANLATAEEKLVIEKVGTPMLQVFIALWKAAHLAG